MRKDENIICQRQVDPWKTLRLIGDLTAQLPKLTSEIDLAWHVSRNVVPALGFNDCVVYFIDPKRRCLFQMAAMGSKNPLGAEIVNRLEIPLGKGITGTVAETGSGMIVSDLSAHPDYIPDIEPALSEICVPIMGDGEVLGVIDCEDPRLNFFTKDDLGVLQMVANLASVQICALRQVVALEREVMEAHAADKAKSSFMANVSHEVRTPLNAIIGFSTIMASTDGWSISREKMREYATDISKSGVHLLALADQLLDLSLIEAERFELHEEPIFLDDLLDDVRTMVMPKFERWEVVLEIIHEVENLRLSGDRIRLRQILINLLDNAVKFSPRCATVILRVAIDDADNLRISVADSGIGIRPEDLERVLGRFERSSDSHETRAETDGAGLGLAMVSALVKAHGGELKIESTLGQGTIVTFILPSERRIETLPVSGGSSQ